jgi:excisionase family DNA binding protein
MIMSRTYRNSFVKRVPEFDTAWLSPSALIPTRRLARQQIGAECSQTLIAEEVWRHLGAQARLRYPATTLHDDHPLAALKGDSERPASAEPGEPALWMRDVDKRSRSLAASWTSHRLAETEERNNNELERLMTITDLSEMLGVPVDTLYGWRHRGEGPAGYRIGRHVRYRRATVEAWLYHPSRPDRLQR